MKNHFSSYERILAATDFSPCGDAAVWQGHWAAVQNHCPLVVAHVISDVRRAVSQTSYQSRIEFLEGQEEHFQRELRRSSDAKLKALIGKLPPSDVKVTYETLLGEPYVELIHTVQQERYDLVVCGARQNVDWIRAILGSTARRLVRRCPASVWVVKRPLGGPPKTILAAVDLSEVSSRAMSEAICLARRAEAKLHIVHVVEANDIPTDLLDLNAAEGPYRSLRELIEDEGRRRFDDFLAETGDCGVATVRHLQWGRAWEQIVDLGAQLHADLIALGTVGRTGLEGLLLGNTAESVLTHCDCDVLAVKPAGFISPVEPATWQLHPGPETTPAV